MLKITSHGKENHSDRITSTQLLSTNRFAKAQNTIAYYVKTKWQKNKDPRRTLAIVTNFLYSSNRDVKRHLCLGLQVLQPACIH